MLTLTKNKILNSIIFAVSISVMTVGVAQASASGDGAEEWDAPNIAVAGASADAGEELNVDALALAIQGHQEDQVAAAVGLALGYADIYKMVTFSMRDGANVVEFRNPFAVPVTVDNQTTFSQTVRGMGITAAAVEGLKIVGSKASDCYRWVLGIEAPALVTEVTDETSGSNVSSDSYELHAGGNVVLLLGFPGYHTHEGVLTIGTQQFSYEIFGEGLLPSVVRSAIGTRKLQNGWVMVANKR